jgi:hypothetical protein
MGIQPVRKECPSMERPTVVTISLVSALYGFVLLSALLFGAVTVYLVIDRTRSMQDVALAEAVDVRGRHAALDFARALNEDWATLTVIADQLAQRDPEALRLALDLTARVGTRVSWVGFAGVDGVVAVSSNGVLMGADVAARPWFQRGLNGDFAGDVHEALLLNSILGGSETEPLRFIDLASPVVDMDGEVKGVLAFHINFDWAKAHLAETARSLEVDLYLVNQAGEVIFATDGSSHELEGLHAFRSAAAGVASSGRELWPDGATYFSTVIPQVRYGDLPSFGWRLVARIAPEKDAEARIELTWAIMRVLVAAGFGLMFLTVLFSRLFILPVGELAKNATRIAHGSDDYPLESRSSAELATLSAALATLQGRRG